MQLKDVKAAQSFEKALHNASFKTMASGTVKQETKFYFYGKEVQLDLDSHVDEYFCVRLLIVCSFLSLSLTLVLPTLRFFLYVFLYKPVKVMPVFLC